MTPDEALKYKQSEMSDTELIEKCSNQISLLCKTYGDSFRMTIPPSINDSDMLLSELVRRYQESINSKNKPNLTVNG